MSCFTQKYCEKITSKVCDGCGVKVANALVDQEQRMERTPLACVYSEMPWLRKEVSSCFQSCQEVSLQEAVHSLSLSFSFLIRKWIVVIRSCSCFLSMVLSSDLMPFQSFSFFFLFPHTLLRSRTFHQWNERQDFSSFSLWSISRRTVLDCVLDSISSFSWSAALALSFFHVRHMTFTVIPRLNRNKERCVFVRFILYKHNMMIALIFFLKISREQMG